MTRSVRADILARIDPTFRERRASARPPSMARPQELLGVRPGSDIVYLSRTAQALLGPDAAGIRAPFTPYRIRGARFTATA